MDHSKREILCLRSHSVFQVIVLLSHPTPPELQLADSHPDIILFDIFVNSFSPSTMAICPGSESAKQCQIMMLPPYFTLVMMASCWFVVPFLHHAYPCEQHSLSFIKPKVFFLVALWSFKVLAGNFKCDAIFFWERTHNATYVVKR